MRPQRNITKSIQTKYVRPIKRKPTLIVEKPIIKEKVDEIIKENKKEKQEDMNNIEISQVDALLQSEDNKPKRKVKIEKKDKGLYERTENSRIILTEDNKMLLND